MEMRHSDRVPSLRRRHGRIVAQKVASRRTHPVESAHHRGEVGRGSRHTHTPHTHAHTHLLGNQSWLARTATGGGWTRSKFGTKPHVQSLLFWFVNLPRHHADHCAHLAGWTLNPLDPGSVRADARRAGFWDRNQRLLMVIV